MRKIDIAQLDVQTCQAQAAEYHGRGFNCAQAVVCTLAPAVGLDPETAFTLTEGFGAGMGCGNTCGALSAAMSVLSLLFCGDKAHETEGFKELCAEYVDTFKASLGSDNCEELKARYRYPEGDDRRCLITVEKAADVLEAFIASHQSEPASDAPSETPVSADEIKRLKGLGFLNNKGTNRFNARVVTGCPGEMYCRCCSPLRQRPDHHDNPSLTGSHRRRIRQDS